jgi:hypothetical protein
LVETIKGLQKYVQSYKDDNERLMKSKDQQDEFNIKLMQSLDRIENKMEKEIELSRSRSHMSHDERGKTRSAHRKHHHSPNHSFRKTRSSSSPSPIRKNNRRTGVDELQGEMNNIKSHTFDSEHKKDEYAETWLLGMRKYFQLHNYSVQVEGRISIYQLKGKASMWWDQFVQVQHIDENKVTQREFNRYFQKKYLTKRYYNKKMKEFYELKLGSMTIDEYERRFLELLKYVTFIKDEKVKIQRYLTRLSSFINEKIQYDDPKTLEETISRAKCLYDQQRGRPNFQKA